MVRFICDAYGCTRGIGPWAAKPTVLAQLMQHDWQVTRTGKVFCPRHRSRDVEEAEE